MTHQEMNVINEARKYANNAINAIYENNGEKFTQNANVVLGMKITIQHLNGLYSEQYKEINKIDMQIRKEIEKIS